MCIFNHINFAGNYMPNIVNQFAFNFRQIGLLCSIKNDLRLLSTFILNLVCCPLPCMARYSRPPKKKEGFYGNFLICISIIDLILSNYGYKFTADKLCKATVDSFINCTKNSVECMKITDKKA